MNEQQRKMFRGILLTEKQRIEQSLKTMISDLKQTTQSTGDSVDEAAALSQTSMELRFKERDKKLLAKVNLALTRLNDGDFGECMDCEDSIGMGRLKIRPVTTLCIMCKEKQERTEREFI